jgi:hypothetical protein
LFQVETGVGLRRSLSVFRQVSIESAGAEQEVPTHAKARGPVVAAAIMPCAAGGKRDGSVPARIRCTTRRGK